MSKIPSNIPPSQNEEVDLGQLFSLIENLVSRFFKFFENLFVKAFNLLILILIVIRKNIFEFSMATIVGGALGLLIQYTVPPTYEGSMVVEPKFQSSRQLYDNINYYNTLVKQRDSIQLSKVLAIDSKQASMLEEFDIEPIESELLGLQQFNELTQNLDSVSKLNFTYENFLGALDQTSYLQHKITVSSKDRLIYTSLQGPILSSISENEYFKERQMVTLKNVTLNDSLTRMALQETDSISAVYQKAMLEEAKKQSAVTSIVMDQDSEGNKEIALLDRKLTLQKQLESNNEKRLDSQEVLKVITGFPQVGYEKDTFFNGFVFLGALLGAILYSLWLLLKTIDAYLLKRINE